MKTALPLGKHHIMHVSMDKSAVRREVVRNGAPSILVGFTGTDAEALAALDADPREVIAFEGCDHYDARGFCMGHSEVPAPQPSCSDFTVPERYVVLDLDGVLNSGRYFSSWKPSASGLVTIDDWYEMLDPAAVARLEAIVQKSGAKVVISSTWRMHKTVEQLATDLREHGFTGRVVGATPELRGGRGVEIQAWMDACGVTAEQIVILDDDSDMLHLRPRLVKTTHDEGLTDAHVTEALRLLGIDA